MKNNNTSLPTVIVLGGGANALSIARSLGRRGVKVCAINDPHEYVRYSRFCEYIPVPGEGTSEESWAKYLVGSESDHLRGAILLVASDAGIQIIAKHRDQLASKFVLDESNVEAQLCMLNKLCTYQKAVAAGVETPRFWLAQTREQIIAARDELVFPLIVKPLLSHVFEGRFGKKFVVAHDFDEMMEAYEIAAQAQIATMLVELIPGPDDRLCSYYTYIDGNGNALFDFTKRVIRRFPAGMGAGCYHITDWNPEVREESMKLFRFVGLRGLANAEFKRDERDGRLKLIECNARFTAANCLVTESGYDLAWFVYSRLAGTPHKLPGRYRTGIRLWDPFRDYHAFRALHHKGELGWGGWLLSIMHPQTLPYFRWYDPMPSLTLGLQEMRAKLARQVDRLGRRLQNILGGRRKEAPFDGASSV